MLNFCWREWDSLKKEFRWLECHQESRCIYAIERKSESGRLVAVFNFSQNTQTDYAVALSDAADIVPLLYTDWETFGGTTPVSAEVCRLEGNRLTCTLQPFSAVLLQIKEKRTSDKKAMFL